MNFLEALYTALFSENIFTWKALGLGPIILFSYSIKESYLISLRFFIFLMVQSILLIIIKPYFSQPGQEIFLITFMMGCEMILCLFIDFLLPQSALDPTLKGFLKRSDFLLPMALSYVILKDLSVPATIGYSIGSGLGFGLVLIIVTSMSHKFCLYRFTPISQYSWKLCVLGILSLIFQTQ